MCRLGVLEERKQEQRVSKEKVILEKTNRPKNQKINKQTFFSYSYRCSRESVRRSLRSFGDLVEDPLFHEGGHKGSVARKVDLDGQLLENLLVLLQGANTTDADCLEVKVKSKLELSVNSV